MIKKQYVILLCLMILFLSGCNSHVDSSSPVISERTVIQNNNCRTEYIDKLFNDSFMPYNFSSENELHNFFICLNEEKAYCIENANSNVEKNEIVDNINNQMENIIKRTYQVYENYDDNYIKEMAHENYEKWQQYYDSQMSMQMKYFEDVYEGGTAIPSFCNSYKYSLLQNQFFNLYELYSVYNMHVQR